MCNLARKPSEGTNEKKLGEEKNFFEIFFAGKVFLWRYLEVGGGKRGRRREGGPFDYAQGRLFNFASLRSG